MDGTKLNRSQAFEESENVGRNGSDNPTMGDIIATRFYRRDLLRERWPWPRSPRRCRPLALAAAAAPKRRRPRPASASTKSRPASTRPTRGAKGYRADILIRWGDPRLPARPHSTRRRRPPPPRPAVRLQQRLRRLSSRSTAPPSTACSCVNHEYTNEELMFPGIVKASQDSKEVELRADDQELVDIEMAAHGGSVVEIRKVDGNWQVVRGQQVQPPHHRADTEMESPARPPATTGCRPTADPSGTKVIGMVNNCAGGVTPWGTWLTRRGELPRLLLGQARRRSPRGREPQALRRARQGVTTGALPRPLRRRRRSRTSRNRFGWMVEIDPFDPASTPKKRTALGRFKHEGAGVIVNKDGRVVVYMGDDERFDYVYRSSPPARSTRATAPPTWTCSTRARSRSPGSTRTARCEWLPLVHGQGPLTAANGFTSQADVLIEARRGGRPARRDQDGPAGGHRAQPGDRQGLSDADQQQQAQAGAGRRRQPARRQRLRPHRRDRRRPTATTRPPRSAGTSWSGAATRRSPRSAPSFSPTHPPNGWFGMPDNCAVDAAGRLWVATDGNSLEAPPAAPTGSGRWRPTATLRGTSTPVLSRAGRCRDVRPVLHARRQDLVRRRAASGRGGSRRQARTLRTRHHPLAGFPGRHAAAAVGRGHHQGGRRRHRRLIDAAGTRSLNVNFRALWCPQARRPPRVSAGGPAHHLGRLKSGCVRNRAASAARFRSARGRERLRHGPENLHRLALLGVRRQPRPSLATQQLRVRLAEEAQGAGDGDVGVAERVPEPERARPPRPVRFQRAEHRPDLQLAALGPTGRDLLVQRALVEQADRLVGSPVASAQILSARRRPGPRSGIRADRSATSSR